MQNPSFVSFQARTGLLYTHEGPEGTTRVWAFNGGSLELEEKGSTFFGFVFQSDDTFIQMERFRPDEILVADGHYFSCNDVLRIEGDGTILIVERLNYRCQNMIGGPIEETGRLKYIDGCTDSLLIPPVKKGDACFNHLHFPPSINQTMHTHPSIRVGMVARGHGNCVTPFGHVALFTGQIFCILPGDGVATAEGLDGKQHPVGSHCFQTFSGTMDVIAYHPDSDFGPEDEEHPMLNRTIVDGVSAKHLDNIRTK